MQLAEAVDEGEVTVAVEAAGMLGTHGDEVAMVDIAQRSRDVTIDGVGIDEDLVTTCRHVTAGKHSIADEYTADVETLPISFVGILVPQQVEVLVGHIVTSIEGLGTSCLFGDTVLEHEIAIDVGQQLGQGERVIGQYLTVGSHVDGAVGGHTSFDGCSVVGHMSQVVIIILVVVAATIDRQTVGRGQCFAASA